MKVRVLLFFLCVSSLSFTQTSPSDSLFMQGGELFRVRTTGIEGFYKTYEDFLNERITDPAEFKLDNFVPGADNRLSIVTKNNNGKDDYELVNLAESKIQYWGARIKVSASGTRYADFRFYDSKLLEIILMGDIIMYSTGGLHVTHAESFGDRTTKMHKKHVQEMQLMKVGTNFTGKHRLYLENVETRIGSNVDQIYWHKETVYFQKGLDGDLIKYSKPKNALSALKDCPKVYTSLKSAKPKGKIERIKELYMHIDIYNHCSKE